MDYYLTMSLLGLVELGIIAYGTLDLGNENRKRNDILGQINENLTRLNSHLEKIVDKKLKM